MDRSRSTLKSRIRDSPFRVNIRRQQVYQICKWSLIAFNGLLILVILGGVFVYFTDLREKNSFKLTGESSEVTFSDEHETKSTTPSHGPKYAWVVSMFAFALLLAIPCLGFIGALKEHVCLLVLYAVFFVLEAVVFLIFRSFWFLVPAIVSVATMTLVVLIREDTKTRDEKGFGSRHEVLQP